MARHRWAAEPDSTSSHLPGDPGDGAGLPEPPVLRPARVRARFRIAAGAAVVVAGAALGTGIARVAGADLERGAEVVASVPLASGSASSGQPAAPDRSAAAGLTLPADTPAAGATGPAARDPGPGEAGSAEAGTEAVLVVHVAGAVARPGVVRLP